MSLTQGDIKGFNLEYEGSEFKQVFNIKRFINFTADYIRTMF